MKNKLIIFFLISFLVRLLFFFFFPDQKFLDSFAYQELGFKFFNNNFILSSTVHMPLYPILSYTLGGRENLILADIIFSSFSVIIIYLICDRFFDTKSANIAAIISIFYPHFIFYSISGLTETLFIFFQLLYLFLLYKKKYIISFIILVLTIYLRPTIEILYPFIIFIFLFFIHNEKLNKTIKYLFLYFFVYIIMMSPWWIHNYVKYEQFVRINLASGQIMYIGNNELNFSGGGISGVDVNLTKFNNIENDIDRFRAFNNEVRYFIFNNPKRFIKLSAKRFSRFWRFYPYASKYNNFLYNSISIISYVPILILSIIFIFKLNYSRFKLISPLLIIILGYTLVHTISIGSIRYRLPIEPFLIIFSSYILSNFYNFSKK